MNVLGKFLQFILQKRNPDFLFFLGVLVLIVNDATAFLQLKTSKVPGEPIYPGKTAFVHSTVSHKTPAHYNASELVLDLKIPIYIIYEHYSSNGSHSPDDVTESQDGNFRFVTFKFNRLLTSEHVGLQFAVHVHQDDGFDDGSFHHAPCVVSLRYKIENPCGSGSLEETRMAMTQIAFFSPDCNGFGPISQLSGGLKDSQITASSSQNETFLPYSAKLEDALGGWIPLRASGEELHDVHFIQVDLRYAIQTKFVAAVQGVSPKIPTNKIFLVLSEDGLEWKEKKNGIITAVDRSADSTITIMKSLKFTATARFVRFVLPPFQKPGGEQPTYKVGLFGCPDDGKTKGKAKKVPVPVGVGMESGVITDNQLTSSSEQGLEYGAQYSRLNSRSGAGAWCAASCDSSEYLQIDLGQVYLIFELEVQSKHDNSESTSSVMSFFFEYSADGASWEYYTANGAPKLFLGSPLTNLAIRHKLLFPVYAESVRFRPQTDACINMACMRVEIYWYPDSDLDKPVIFGRSFLLVESTNTIFVCNTEVTRSESPCKGSTDGGETWKDLQHNILNVLGYDPIKDVYYGMSTNKKTYKRSKFSPFLVWTGITNRMWFEMRDSPLLITATEVPFIPVLLRNLEEPYEALTVPSSAILLKRRRRSVASVDMWGYTKVDCLAMPCDNGVCTETPDGGYKCNCFTGFTGKNCRKGNNTSPRPLATCSAVKSSSPEAVSADYVIDPDGEGGYEPFTVYCDMTDKNEVGVTVVSHDSEARTLVNGYEKKGTYVRNISYTGAGLTSIAQLAGLADVSVHCEQFIKYECYDSELLLNGKSKGWWVSRDNVAMTYWGGATPADLYKCACGLNNTCANPDRGCNCDKNKPVWLEDSGFLTEKSDLPVSQLRFGDTGGDSESGYHTLGKFKCYGLA
ncbi:hypothetical protein ACROYT_G017228 [Oculina patagonica]